MGTVGLMSVLLLPIASAQGQEKGVAAGQNTAANLCARIESQVSNLVSKVSDRVGKVGTAHADKESQLNNAWSKFDSDQKNSRGQEDANLSARFSKLEEMGKTDVQKQAISTFEVAVKSALEAKRAAMDAAVKTFHDNVDNLMNSRKTVVSNNLSVLETTFQAAGNKVKSDCAAGTNAKTVRTEFLSAVKEAQKNYDTAKKNQDDFSSQMKALTRGKQAAFDKAKNDFKSAMEQARNALKVVLGSTATSSNP